MLGVLLLDTYFIVTKEHNGCKNETDVEISVIITHLKTLFCKSGLVIMCSVFDNEVCVSYLAGNN